jgi:hypothetical protein
MLRNRKVPITSPRDWSAVYSLAQETRGRSVRRHFIVVRLTADIMTRYCCSRDTGSHHDDLSSPQQQISSCTSSRNEGWIWSVEGRPYPPWARASLLQIYYAVQRNIHPPSMIDDLCLPPHHGSELQSRRLDNAKTAISQSSMNSASLLVCAYTTVHCRVLRSARNTGELCLIIPVQRYTAVRCSSCRVQ